MKGSILIAGPAGFGLNTFTDILSKILKTKGCYVFSNKDYMSRVRGGFNFTKIRFDTKELFTFDSKLDYLIALDKQGISKIEDLKESGCLIGSNVLEIQDKSAFLLDERYIKSNFGKSTFSMATLGVLLWDLGIDLSIIDNLFLGKWPEHIIDANKKAVCYGYEQRKLSSTSKREAKDENKFFTENKKTILVSGNQAIALGAAAGGIDFYCAYPMAPSTGVMNYLNEYSKEMNIIVEQAEDEIAAINAAIGASSTGVRAMTGSSGGGYALMVEALGFAAIGEVPLVVVDVQRPGPATGLPTRTEQADLSFVLYASQGEFSRMIVAPRSVEDAFYQTFRSLNIADKYNMPVTILSDEYLADTVSTVPLFNLENLKIERHIENEFIDYKRYNFNHITGHRAYAGLDVNTLIMTDSHVHDEDGFITEGAEETIKLKHKLMAKQEALKEEVLEPLYIGVEKPKALIISWGSTYGAIKEAVEILMEKGKSIGMLSFSDIFPLPTDKLTHYAGIAEKIINIEQNYSNQFGKVLILEANVRYDVAINKYDGRPFSKDDILSALEVHL